MALYGLKKAPRAWYGRIDSFITRLVFTKSKFSPNIYMKVMDDEPVILSLYVEEFEMKYLGLMHYFLGMEVW